MRYLILCFVFGTLLFGASSCKRECHDASNPDCENYDPCYGKQKLTAGFNIFESKSFPNNWIPYDTDSLYSIDANFAAKEDGVEYEWKIGAETLTTKKVSRNNFPVGVKIPITLTVRRKEGLDCFPDDSIAKKTRYIYVVPDYKQLRINGCFQGYNIDSPNDTFTVCIKLYDSVTFPDWLGKSTISGLIKASTCPNKTFFITDTEHLGYKQYTFLTSHGDCLLPSGRVRVDSAQQGNIRIDYSYYKVITDINSKVNKTFVGKRIQ